MPGVRLLLNDSAPLSGSLRALPAARPAGVSPARGLNVGRRVTLSAGRRGEGWVVPGADRAAGAELKVSAI